MHGGWRWRDTSQHGNLMQGVLEGLAEQEQEKDVVGGIKKGK